MSRLLFFFIPGPLCGLRGVGDIVNYVRCVFVGVRFVVVYEKMWIKSTQTIRGGGSHTEIFGTEANQSHYIVFQIPLFFVLFSVKKLYFVLSVKFCLPVLFSDFKILFYIFVYL